MKCILSMQRQFYEWPLPPKSGPSPIDEIISVTGSNRPEADVETSEFLGMGFSIWQPRLAQAVQVRI
ncbi:MAG: hypothetical protein V3V96_16300, partial [Acidiferrobacterales bacterium]